VKPKARLQAPKQAWTLVIRVDESFFCFFCFFTSWSCYCALLVESSVSERVGRRDDVGTKVAAQLALSTRAVAVSHHQIRIESQRRIDYNLALCGSHDGAQPARLATVGQQKHHVVFVNKSTQRVELLSRLVHVGRRNRMAWHRNAKLHPANITLGKNTFHSICRSKGLFLGIYKTKNM
jgi:hypothetical protein